MACSRLAAAKHEKEKPAGVPFDADYANTYMLDRARESPMAYIVLLELRFLETIFMMLDAEGIGERGDFELFLAAQRIRFYRSSSVVPHLSSG